MSNQGGIDGNPIPSSSTSGKAELYLKRIQKYRYALLGLLAVISFLVGHYCNSQRPTFCFSPINVNGQISSTTPSDCEEHNGLVYYKESIWDFRKTLAEELTIAFTVAIVLIFVVEKVSDEMREEKEKERRKEWERSEYQLIGKIKTNLYEAVFNKFMHPDLHPILEKSLFDTEMLRRKFHVYYTFGKVYDESDSHSYIKCELVVTYELHNLGGKERQPDITCALDLPLNDKYKSECKFTHFELRDESDKVVYQVNDGESIESKGLVKSTSKNIGFKYNDYSLKPNGFVKVMIRGINPRRKTDMDNFSMALPADSIRITAGFDDSDVVEVEVDVNHPERIADPTGTERSKAWVFDQPLLIGQGFNIWWHHRRSV